MFIKASTTIQLFNDEGREIGRFTAKGQATAGADAATTAGKVVSRVQDQARSALRGFLTSLGSS